MPFKRNDRVTIRPTGDADIDKLLGKELTITEITPTKDGDYRYNRYTVATDAGESTTVIEEELRHVV